MRISAVFGIFTVFFNHYHYLIPEYRKETPYSLPLTTTDLLLCLHGFVNSGYFIETESYNVWPLCLTSFT